VSDLEHCISYLGPEMSDLGCDLSAVESGIADFGSGIWASGTSLISVLESGFWDLEFQIWEPELVVRDRVSGI
jgi:hypothetical protein